jgi:hypothetical protein
MRIVYPAPPDSDSRSLWRHALQDDDRLVIRGSGTSAKAADPMCQSHAECLR